jgi:hypothetical protein
MGIGGPVAGDSRFMGRYFRRGAMIETESDKLVAEPSQGSHFFHNITTLGINYITVSKAAEGRIDWDWLTGAAAC